MSVAVSQATGRTRAVCVTIQRPFRVGVISASRIQSSSHGLRAAVGSPLNRSRNSQERSRCGVRAAKLCSVGECMALDWKPWDDRNWAVLWFPSVRTSESAHGVARLAWSGRIREMIAQVWSSALFSRSTVPSAAMPPNVPRVSSEEQRRAAHRGCLARMGRAHRLSVTHA